MEYWWSYHRTKKQEQEREGEGEGHAIVFFWGLLMSKFKTQEQLIYHNKGRTEEDGEQGKKKGIDVFGSTRPYC
jgi:hypothetical protein